MSINRISKDNMPSGPWRNYRKTTETSMVHMGPLEEAIVCETKEGPYDLPEGWEGFIAVDTDGDPYPIAQAVHDASYEEV